MYAVKEIFKTLQGEGGNAGKAFVFCRFTGCNLWSGREQDRETAACRFCDTDFVGTSGVNGGKYSAEGLCDKIATIWDNKDAPPRVVFTGGEPLLQLDYPLIKLAKEKGFYIAIETNGTIDVPAGIDHICVSPKAGSVLKVTGGHELKVVYPQKVDPEIYLGLDFDSFYLQPMDGYEGATTLAIEYCLQHTQWQLSLQTHKIMGLP